MDVESARDVYLAFLTVYLSNNFGRKSPARPKDTDRRLASLTGVLYPHVRGASLGLKEPTDTDEASSMRDTSRM